MAEEKPESKKAEGKKVARISSAKKREIQSEKKRLKNRSYRAGLKTTLKEYQKSLSTAEATKKLSEIYSVVDKGVKKGIIKANKASRIKARMSKKLQATASK